MNPEDVFHDVQKAVVERKRVFVSRSEANGKIRWVIEIENEPLGSQVHGRLRDMFDQFGSRDIRRDLDRPLSERSRRGENGDE
jgi:hypothetical protein